MIKKFLSVVLVLGGLSASAQTFDEYRQSMLDGFDVYKTSESMKYSKYRDMLNAMYSEYMRQAWVEYDGEPPVHEPAEVPDVPPVVYPDLGVPDIPDSEVPYVDIIPLEFEDLPPVPLMPLPDVPQGEPGEAGPTVDIMFYGTACSFSFDLNDRAWLKDVSEESAAEMWLLMSGDEYDYLLFDCLRVRSEMNLCDWAFYMLVDTLAEAVYGIGNEAVMLTAFIMSQSGYKLKIARSDAGSFHLLVCMTDGIYACPYFRINGYDYYLTDGSDMTSLYVFDKDFPNENALRLSISQSQKFAEDISESKTLMSRRYPDALVHVGINRNLLDFYEDYPHPYRNAGDMTSWTFYATAPLGAGVESGLLHPLSDLISGKTQEESANILLNFVQTAFEYMTDDEQWGYERPFFPEETMYYPYSDCEDRAILYSRLVRELMGLDVAFLQYPGHLATAVRFDEDIRGDHVIIGGARYLVCDPTYINAPIGMQMPGLDYANVKVVRISE